MPSVMVRMSSVSSSIMRTVSRISWSVKGMGGSVASLAPRRTEAEPRARFGPAALAGSGLDAAGLSSPLRRAATTLRRLRARRTAVDQVAHQRAQLLGAERLLEAPVADLLEVGG